MLLFIPVAAVIRLACLFVVILITAVLIIPVKKPGGNVFGINIDIGLDPSPDEGIGCLLGAYLCSTCNEINGEVSRMKYHLHRHVVISISYHFSADGMHHVW